MVQSTYCILWTQSHTYGKIAVHPYTPLVTTTATSLALALDVRHTNERNRHMQAVLLC
jgi:hypothetical protein